jgi:two-component system, response regulator
MTSRAILLIEDNPDNAARTPRRLRKGNILNSVTVVHDGAAALGHLSSLNSADMPFPAVVPLDLHLPDFAAAIRRAAVR